MSQGDTLHQSDPSQDILQRRLSNETMTMTTAALLAPPPRSARKILFGVPDPDLPRTVLANLSQRKWSGFCDRWNVDPVTGRPGGGQLPGTETTPSYNWSLVSTNDPEVKSETKAEPTPSIATVPMAVVATASVIVGHSSSPVPSKSPEANQDQSSVDRTISPGPGGKRFCSDARSALRQRSIKDYMKERKVLPSLVSNPEEKAARPIAPCLSSGSEPEEAESAPGQEQ